MKKKMSSRSSASARLATLRMSVADRERIEAQLRQIQEQKTRDLREMQKKRDDIRRGDSLADDEHRKDDKWDINQMSEFDFVRCDYSQW